MPNSAQIRRQLAELANQWIPLSIAWHLVIAGVFVALLFGWRPGRRTTGLFLASLGASVAAVAWLGGNPFNGALFTVLSALLAAIALRLPTEPVAVRAAPLAAVIAGSLSLGFGLVYPHFLDRPLAVYLVAAPVGVVPCPSLAVIIGLTLLTAGFESRAWCWVLVAAGAFYALFGVWRLGVVLDTGLLAGTLALALVATAVPRSPRRRDAASAAIATATRA